MSTCATAANDDLRRPVSATRTLTSFCVTDRVSQHGQGDAQYCPSTRLACPKKLKFFIQKNAQKNACVLTFETCIVHSREVLKMDFHLQVVCPGSYNHLPPKKSHRPALRNSNSASSNLVTVSLTHSTRCKSRRAIIWIQPCARMPVSQRTLMTGSFSIALCLHGV